MVIGYGSIGKRHVGNLISLGIKPYVITKYPDDADVFFSKNAYNCKDIDHTIIATPTAFHLRDFENVVRIGCKRILLEKPIEVSLRKAKLISKLAKDHNIQVYVAYNMRFLHVFRKIREIINSNFDEIRLVKIIAGSYLPKWRDYNDYRISYSAHREKGGGVDLDLSHEIDYMLWLFGKPMYINYIERCKLSKLEIKSPDYFKGIYGYKNFIVDVELDYFRLNERKLRIIGENKDILNVDFINKNITFNNDIYKNSELFNFENSYIDELKEFFEIKQRENLSTIDEGILTMETLKLE